MTAPKPRNSSERIDVLRPAAGPPEQQPLKDVFEPHSEPILRRAGPRPKPTFNLEPEVIPHESVPLPEESTDLALDDLTEAELKELKDQSQKRIKRIVAAVGITLTLISIILVALSLSLGQKIDQLVGEKTRLKEGSGSGAEESDGTPRFFLGAKKPTNQSEAFR